MGKVLESSAWLPEPRGPKWRSKWIPTILDEDLFPVHDTLWDELIERCNDESFRIRNKWRRVLNNHGNEYFDGELRRAIKGKRNVIFYVTGGQGIGKSYGVIPVEIRCHELFAEIGLDLQLGIWSFDYPESNTKFSEAEKRHKIYFVHQDEDPDPTGAGSVEAKRAIIDNVDQQRWNRHCMDFLNPKFDPDFKERMTFRLEIVGYNPETGISLFILYNKFNRPMCYLTVPMRLDYMWLYEDYDGAKADHSHLIAKHGGSVSSINIQDINNKAEEIYVKFTEINPDAAKITYDDIRDAAALAGVTIVTTREKAAPIFKAVIRLFKAQHDTSQAKEGAFTTPKGSKAERYKTVEARQHAGHIYRKSKQWEVDFKTKYAPLLFDKYVDLAESGEVDGVGMEKGDHTKVVVALENGNYPKSNQTTVYMGDKAGKEGGRIYREIAYARMQRKLGENVKLILYFKEESRNKVYPVLVDLDKPRSHTIHFDVDSHLPIQ